MIRKDDGIIGSDEQISNSNDISHCLYKICCNAVDYHYIITESWNFPFVSLISLCVSYKCEHHIRGTKLC